uniref:Uncharacterized protein n=1 Tax=Arundo donax TaxID=35708 RepID=A0A0A9B9U4_ARUDO
MLCHNLPSPLINILTQEPSKHKFKSLRLGTPVHQTPFSYRSNAN